MRSSMVVAKKIVECANSSKEPESNAKALTLLKLLKLVYISHGWTLALLDRPLINDGVEAWKYGPVIPALYEHLKECERNPITLEDIGVTGEAPDLDDNEVAIVEFVYENYGSLDAWKLSSITHKKDSPWDMVFNSTDPSLVISDEVIKGYYESLIPDYLTEEQDG